jgi:phosphate transport system protein
MPLIRSVFQDELDSVSQTLLELSVMVSDSMAKATRAILTKDLSLAEEVISFDEKIDSVQHELDARIIDIIARQQPVASDLRALVTALRMSADLERMGDLAEEIAQQGLHLTQTGNWSAPGRLQKLSDLATLLVRNSLDAFVRLDPELARLVIRMEIQASHLVDELIAGILQSMGPGGSSISPGISFFTITKALERVANHASNIAEDVIYLAEGEIVRHSGQATPLRIRE